jgi:GT2 family glycosyltransferase
MSTPVTSIIIPAYNASGTIRKCLAALCASGAPGEIIVVDDGSTDGTASLAEAPGVQVLRLPRSCGPGAARNHGARHAEGETLFFVDADVAVAADAIAEGHRTLAATGAAAVFGSYDAQPSAPGIVSQFRNLLHHYVHQRGKPEAFTFWAACGAVRRAAFEAIGGFDERGPAAVLEDVDLGYRLRAAGYRIVLDKAMLCTHLKRWTLASMIRTDVRFRAVPWARLLLESGPPPEDLNLSRDQRWSVMLTGVSGLGLGLGVPLASWVPIAVAAGALAVVVALNRPFYAFLRRERGLGFAVASVPLHLVHLACGGVGFVYAWLDARRAARRETADRAAA